MQAGIAVVGPSFKEVGLIVRSTGCGALVDTASAIEVSRAVFRLLEHPEQTQEMGGNGRKAFEERFNWEIEQNKLIKFFNRFKLAQS